MTPERWKQIRAVYEQAEQLSASDQSSYLSQACAGDAELRLEVESLLKAQSRAGSEFMGRPAADLMQPINNGAGIASRVGRRIGPYEIVDEIGHGGMGEVYRAVRIDGQFDQQVAIKLVRVGMGSAFVVERFLHERQILATLNHPNIARLLDGGTTDDRVPYFVMELIEGDRVDQYCQAQKLSVTERLRIFLQVCAAVEYAHQRLVIHRDIKPSNILVTQDGTPKLLDFGIAKLLDPSIDAETTMARPMTLEYASPEQIRGEPITTATDVYSLGIVLYQLLTGRSPYRVTPRTPHLWSHAITDTDPQRPSSVVLSPFPVEDDEPNSATYAQAISSEREPTPVRLRRRLAGDIDSILLKALRKEPERRYGSVQQFAEDITRHLNGLPVTSTRGSWNYTARKFVTRHRTGVTAVAVVMLALVGGVVATERQARIARQERARAQKRFDDVRQFSNSLIFEIHDALQDIPGTTSARDLLLDRAVQYLDRVAKDADGDSDLQRELAWGYQRLATVQGDSTVSNVGQVSAAEISAKKAMALFETVAGANPNNIVDQLNVAMIHRQKAMSDVYYPGGRPEIEKALAVTDRLMQTNGEDSKVRMERAIELQVIGASLDISGDHDRSAAAYRQSLEMIQALARSEPGYKTLPQRIAKAEVQLGFELSHTGALDDGQRQLEAGVAAYERLLTPGAQPDIIRDLAQSRFRLGFVQEMRGDLAGAKTTFQKAHDALVPLARADPQNILFRIDVLSAKFELGRLLVMEGRFPEADAQLSHIVADFVNLNSEEDIGPGYGVLYAWLGESQFASRQFDRALKSFKKAVEYFEKGPQYDDARCGIATGSVLIGNSYKELKRLTEAESAYKTALSNANPQNDLPALFPVAAAYAAMANLRMMSAAKAHTSEERTRLLTEACTAYVQGIEVQHRIPITVTFSSSGFPIPPMKAATNVASACSGIPAQTHQ
jgi:serine/threonine protein kinase/tetratricopeptide (TPR) repeat protein